MVYNSMKCLSCKKNTSDWQLRFYNGLCGQCYIADNQAKNTSVRGEWSRKAKQELSTFAKDTLQPLKKDGTINKDFVQAHGTQSLEKNLGMTSKQIHESVNRYG